MNDFYASVSEPGWLSLCSRETDRVLQRLRILQASEDHRNFILSTWVKSYAANARKLGVVLSAETTKFAADAFSQGEGSVAERHWDKSRVLVSEDDAFTIHGWVCGEPGSPGSAGRLWHVYVPPDLRGKGVARALVEETCGKSYVVSKPWPRTPKGHLVTWNPYINGP